MAANLIPFRACGAVAPWHPRDEALELVAAAIGAGRTA